MSGKNAGKSTRLTPRFTYAIELTVDRSSREQNRFLDHCQQKRINVTVFSTSGATFNGIVWMHDRESLLFGGKGKSSEPRLIRKNFIALIVPREDIQLFTEYMGFGTAGTKNRRKKFMAAIKRRLAEKRGTNPLLHSIEPE